MPSISFEGVAIMPVSDPEDELHFPAADVVGTDTVTGKVEAFAGGRLRLIRSADAPRQVKVVLPLVPRDKREILESWRGGFLQYRDARGRLIFGTFLKLDAVEVPGSDWCDISLTFDEISHSIEVEEADDD